MNTVPRNLAGWLEHAERQHVVGVDLGLERVARVAAALGFEAPGHRPAPRNVIVAGTNGKGSVCVALEALLSGAGVRVGTTLSPHLHRFNERVRVAAAPLDDRHLCDAFAAVEAARGAVPLTYFEYGALVAMVCFRRADVDVAILEVGLGGRLDAMNLVSADLAVITSIGLDHQDYLGDDLESIGREKAGVLRPGQHVVLGREVSESVLAEADALGCRSSRLGADLEVRAGADGWDFHAPGLVLEDLPRGALAPDNCALALAAAAHLTPIDADLARAALARAELPGRFERWRMPGPGPSIPLILDVAHNPAAAAFLARRVAEEEPGRRFVAVLGSLADKDAAGVAAALDPLVAHWICIPTPGPRGRSAAATAAQLGAARSTAVEDDMAAALRRARTALPEGGGILTLGAFSVIERARLVLQAGLDGAVPERSSSNAAGDDGR